LTESRIGVADFQVNIKATQGRGGGGVCGVLSDTNSVLSRFIQIHPIMTSGEQPMYFVHPIFFE